MQQRKLDGIYFRVMRDGQYQSICFSDLTHMEMEEVLKDKNIDYLKDLCIKLADALEFIGNTFDLGFEDYVEK